MNKAYYLIETISNVTYWNYRLDESDDPLYSLMVSKYGSIYVNRNGGWMPLSCAKRILETVVQKDFPPEIDNL